MCTKQQRIAETARQRPQERLTALNPYLDVEWLTEAFHRVRRNSAPGVAGQTVTVHKVNRIFREELPPVTE